jgi:hypothetical protein
MTQHNVSITNENYTAYKWIGNNRVAYQKFETKCKNCGMYFHGATNEEVQSFVKTDYYPSCAEVKSNVLYRWFFCKSWTDKDFES